MEVSDQFPEEFLYWIWDEGYFLKNELKLADGRRCGLIYRGERNTDAGPDFKNVSLDIEGKIISGDIEIHRNSKEWMLHNHHHDEKYNRVIMHVVLIHTGQTAMTTREDGVNVPILILGQYLKQPLNTLYKRYLEQHHQEEMKLDKCPLSQKEVDEILNRVEYAGGLRLELKAMAFREQRAHGSWEQILYRGLMEALGYSKNQIPFRKLANRLPVEFIYRELRDQPKDEAELLTQGILFGAAGLLPRQSRHHRGMIEGETKEISEKLKLIWEDYWHRIGIMPMKAEEWQFFRLRPQNFPTRRLAAMCSLLVKFYEEGLLKTSLRIFQGLQNDLELLISELEKILICEASGYWKRHFQFDETRATESSDKANLLGASRASDMVVNILLPTFFLYAQETEDGRLLSIVKEVYKRYPPLADNVITREMMRKLFRQKRIQKRWINTAQKQQGLIHIQKIYCSENKCDACIRDLGV